MTGSIRWGRVIVVAALLLLVACSFAIYYGVYHLGLVHEQPSPSVRDRDTVLGLVAAPLLAFGAWWSYPRSARWIVAAYGLLALLFGYFSVMFLFVPLFVSDQFPDNNVAGIELTLMGSVLGISAALFAAVGCLLAFSRSVRDFGNYRRESQQAAFRKRHEENG